MSLPVSLDLVIAELEMIADETAVFVNRKTGEIVTVSTIDLGIVEEGREEEEELEWGDESLPILRSISETQDWLCLPDKFEIHEWQIMREFAEWQPPALAEELSRAIHGRGAFRMFKDALDRHDVREEWFSFKRDALKRIASEALDAAGIPYR